MAPNLAILQSNLGLAYSLNGMYQQAIERYQKVRELDPNEKGNALASIATVLVSAGRMSEADSMMAEILKLAREGKANPYYIVELYAARGEKDAAFAWLEKVLQINREEPTNGNDAPMIRYDPMLDSLRSDSRFATLLRQHDRGRLVEAHDGH